MTCTHHYYLGSPHDGIISARCIKCGYERDFPANPENDDFAKARRKKRGKRRIDGT